jgi:rhodanese-related sulfurtransferase
MREISPTELNVYLNAAATRPILLDVREPREYRHCRIEGSLHIPMNEVPARLAELDSDREVVVICHHGIRSRMVADYLVSRNFQRVVNLSGGIDAWACQVQPDMPRY